MGMMIGERKAGTASLIGLIVGVLGLAGLIALKGIWPDEAALPDRAQDLITLSMSVVIESLPFVILGIVLSIVVQVWVPAMWIERILPRNKVGRRAVISLMGMFLPVCECGNVPLARGLIIRGFTVPEAMTFVVAAPILNPVTIITTHQAFGFDDHILVARLIGGFLVANLIGWLFSKHSQPELLLTKGFRAECELSERPATTTRWQRSVNLFTRESGVIMPALLFGSLVAGAVQVFVPRSVLVSLGSDPLWSVLAMLALAFIISICANVDSFFILPFAATFMPGSIVAFLVLGPIIDIKMLSLLRTTFTTRTLIQFSVVIILFSAALGWAVNIVA